MSNNVLYFIFLLFLNPVLLAPSCKEGTNNCNRCDPLTKLFINCTLDIYSPDENGGCSALGKCTIGKNYCSECDDDGKICTKCETGLYPDKNGACSFVNNCKISNKGFCLQCRSDFILIGGENNIFNICKHKNSEDFRNCTKINKNTGLCDECGTGYFLNQGDLKCSKTENCYESSFGKCTSCISGFYLDKTDNKCKSQSGSLISCKVSLDGEKCDICEDDFFFDENGNCIGVNYCAEAPFYGCRRCMDEYYLTYDRLACTKEKNCYSGEYYSGLCNYCFGNYYIDLDSRKCKSNQKEDDFKYCKKAENGKCLSCDLNYQLSEDRKCSITSNCEEVDNGICVSCSDNYYLTLDNRCVKTEHCIYSESYYECTECEDGYYYNKNEKVCLEYKDNFENCKSTSYDGGYCFWCKKGFYNNQTDHLCYSNKEKNNFYKCTLSDTQGKYCIGCEDKYFIGYTDHKCSKIEGCDKSENEEKCIECDESFCLNRKTGVCKTNLKVINEEDKFYYRCNITNKEGDKCAVCLDGYELSEDGLCVDTVHCTRKKDGVCVKCQNNREYSSCLNVDFGCVPTSYMKCIECNNNLDFDECSKCPEYYVRNEKGVCIDIDDVE